MRRSTLRQGERSPCPSRRSRDVALWSLPRLSGSCPVTRIAARPGRSSACWRWRPPRSALVSCAPVSGAPRKTEKILVAVAWPYASGPRHIGHVAGFGVPSDIFARYHRLKGNDVLMVSGTDEHGTPVMVAADREGVSPRELADRFNQLIREDLRKLGL